MNRSDFLDFLTRFASQPIPATLHRHVYLWMGEIEELISLCPPGFIHKMDLHLLCRDITKTPLGDKAAGRVLSDVIDEWLSKNFPPSSQQQALLVSGLDLFYRYGLPLSVFIRLTNEKRMVIFALSALDVNFIPAEPLPNYIQFSPRAILKYTASGFSEEAIVKED